MIKTNIINKTYSDKFLNKQIKKISNKKVQWNSNTQLAIKNFQSNPKSKSMSIIESALEYLKNKSVNNRKHKRSIY